ncbi:MAG: RluA family pseudouridine synthase [Sandaracinaceae bacterium]
MNVTLQVAEVEAGSRLDHLLVRRVDGMSRARARRMIQDGAVRVNGRRVRKGARLAAGDSIELARLPPPKDFVPRPAPELGLAVRHEDPHVVVVDKPGGQPSHPLRPDERATLANALVARYPEMVGVGYALREAGLLHRLDNGTSGVLVAARDRPAFEALRHQLRSGGMDKRYLALVSGPYEGPDVIDVPIAPHPADPRRVHVSVRASPRARLAATYVRVVRSIGERTLLEVRAAVATRHQVRAHLASVGYPLLGDWLYGGEPGEGLERHFLHASELRFTHPVSEARVTVRAPLPPELAHLVGSPEPRTARGAQPGR